MYPLRTPDSRVWSVPKNQIDDIYADYMFSKNWDDEPHYSTNPKHLRVKTKIAPQVWIKPDALIELNQRPANTEKATTP